jgi:serine/threonine protein kinase
MPHPAVQRTAWQLASALHHCHKRGIFVRDVKPDNVLMSDTMARICDFGLAVSTEYAYGLGGTFGFMASEVIKSGLSSSQPYSCASVDVWSLGAVLHHSFFGRAPFGVTLRADQAAPQDPRLALEAAMDASTPVRPSSCTKRCKPPLEVSTVGAVIVSKYKSQI